METYNSQNQPQPPQPSEQEKLKCPRCDSMNTKFCYYNNYNLSQPRHFCKGCRRYWTKGGALRNIPVGGGSKKSASKRGSAAKRPTASATAEEKGENETFLSLNGDYFGQGQYGNFAGMGGKEEGYFGQGQFGNFAEMGEFGQGQFGSFAGMGPGGFSSMLVGSSSGAQFGGLLDGFGLGGPSLRESNYFGDLSLGQNVVPHQTDGFLNIGGGGGNGAGDWDDGDGGWPDLAI